MTQSSTPTSPFDFVNDISFGKKDLMRGSDNDALVEKKYNAFQYLINTSLSYFIDTVFFANEMNIREVDSRMHYTYLLNAIRPKKRFSKWEKLENSEAIELIQKFYGYSYKKAKEAVKLLSPTQIETIKSTYNKGGNNNGQ